MTDPNTQDALEAAIVLARHARNRADTGPIGSERMVVALDDARLALVAEVERLREALEYALAQHEQPGRFSPMHNHWSAKAHAALSTANSARIAKARE